MRARKKLSEAERFAILGRISASLMSEQDEGRLLHLIAQSAVDLTGAEFAAFTLRPVDKQGKMLVPAEGNLFHLAAVTGVTAEQEALFRRMPLGGEGLLAPIFRYKTLVRVADIYAITRSVHEGHAGQVEAREAAFTFTHGQMASEELRSIGLPHGHPMLRSFLGAPLLDSDQEVRGGLLLGHSQPDQFSEADEAILQGLAAQAAVAVENTRLYHSLRMRVQELQTMFESIDLEQRIRVEAETRLSLLQGILDELPTSVYLVHGKDARLVLANKATNAVWGAVWEQGKPMQTFLQENHIQIFRNDGLPMLIEQLATLRAVQQGETISAQQETIRQPDGTALPVQVNAIALDTARLPIQLPHILSSHHEPEPMALVVHQDVSALKEAEQLKEDFISIAAHELRNPLAALHGFVSLLLTQSAQEKGTKLVSWQQESLQGIEQSTTRLVALANDLLDVTRLQAGRLELRPEATDLIALVKRVIRRFQLISEKYQLVMSSQAEFLVCSLDGQRIEQVITNLLTNAVKYNPQGGLIEVLLWEEKEQARAVVSIKDTGIGIPAHQQAYIFGRFVRAENGQALGIPGTGLGLYLSREFVERHGGHLWFQSHEGKGSTFFVSLPLLTLPQDEIAENFLQP